jgi:hypothetical protein
MRFRLTSLLAIVFVAYVHVEGQSSGLQPPKTAVAGNAFSIFTTGSGKATLYAIGPGGALKREIQLGQPVSFNSDDLHNAGRYVVFLVSNGATQSTQFDLLPSPRTASLSFLAKPSRLPVNVENGLSGVVYLFDLFGNLIEAPRQVSFELAEANGTKQTQSSNSAHGVAWVRMNSAQKAGSTTLIASVGEVSEKRVVQQVAGEPCSLKMTARRDGANVILETDPVRDCAGNPIPDGTIVTFTEMSGPRQATVDVPVKRGVARTELPNEPKAVISVAAGVVMGNEIRWSGGQ